MLERMITIEEFAEALGVSVQTVYSWNSQGVGPRYIKVGKHCRFRPAEIQKWLESRTVDRRREA
jgi:excisionase family DNA binding protein